MVFFGYMPRSIIAVSYDSSIFSFKEISYCFPKWLYQLTLPPTVYKGSLFSTASPVFIVCRFFDDGQSDQCAVISYCFLICISLIIGDVQNLFKCLLTVCISYLE